MEVINLTKDKQINLKLSVDLYGKIDSIAKEKEIATSALIRLILKDYAEQEAKKDK
jgi:hypothetical protein